MKTFAQRFFELSTSRSPLCLGIDPAPQLLHDWGLPDSVAGLTRFCETVMEAADGTLAVIKPQSAFFERFGPEGLAVLAAVIKSIREQETLALLDCKRGDIGTTLEAYADAFLGSASPYQADAITVSPYLGLQTLQPAFLKANATATAVFVVVRSSNPEGRALQNAMLPDGIPAADSIADGIAAFNRSVTAEIGPVGAVIGATLAPSEAQTLDRLAQSLILAPGIGAQGASFADMANTFGERVRQAIPSISRGILKHGPDVKQLKRAIGLEREALQAAWLKYADNGQAHP